MKKENLLKQVSAYPQRAESGENQRFQGKAFSVLQARGPLIRPAFPGSPSISPGSCPPDDRPSGSSFKILAEQKR